MFGEESFGGASAVTDTAASAGVGLCHLTIKLICRDHLCKTCMPRET